MKVALVGASGNVGRRILDELASRGHSVTPLSRQGKPLDNDTPVQRLDISDAAAAIPLLRGHDAVISSLRANGLDLTSLLSTIKSAGVGRLIVVGGAGSLEGAPGQQVVDSPNFPPAFKPEALAHRDMLNSLREQAELNWTYISPSALFAAGERTGRFRIGRDRLLVDENGKSSVSYEDFAMALVNELEKPEHSRSRFTVGY